MNSNHKLNQKAAYLLGVSTPLLPLLGGQWLLLLLCLFLIILSPHIFKIRPTFLIGFSLSVLLWGFFLFLQGDVLRPVSLVLGQALIGLGWISFALLCSLLFSTRELRDSLGKGLIRFGAPVAMALSLLQFLSWRYQIFDLSFPNESEFWNAMGRPSGTFTDPNAYGVWCGLFVCMLFSIRQSLSKNVFLFLAPLTLICGALSGSRTFWLALVSYGFLTIVFSSSRKMLKQLSVVVIAAFLVGVVLFLTVNISYTPLKGVSRITDLISGVLQGDFRPFYSRFYFTLINLAVISDYPYFGVGPEVFPSLVPGYGEKLNIPLAAWADNPNNFYLGIVSEFGVLGAILFVAGLSGVQIRQHYPLILTLLIVLFTGPHQRFYEVQILMAFLLSQCVELRAVSFREKLVGLTLFLIVAGGVLLSASKTEYGLYNWEHTNEIGWYRWTEQNFRVRAKCNTKNASTLMIRNAQLSGVKVKIEYLDNKFSLYSLESGEILSVETYCDSVKGHVSNVWRPGEGDQRELGVQLLFESPAKGSILSQP